MLLLFRNLNAVQETAKSSLAFPCSMKTLAVGIARVTFSFRMRLKKKPCFLSNELEDTWKVVNS